MSEPLSKIKVFCGCGDEMKMGNYDPDISAVSYKCSIGCGNQVFIEPDLDQRSPEVEKLARIIYEQQYNRNININSSCPDWKKEAPYVKERFVLLAQEIINKMNVWIVKESSGQCNHEFMQQYDFSKFSNAGNSLKCVKCGLIKKG